MMRRKLTARRAKRHRRSRHNVRLTGNELTRLHAALFVKFRRQYEQGGDLDEHEISLDDRVTRAASVSLGVRNLTPARVMAKNTVERGQR